MNTTPHLLLNRLSQEDYASELLLIDLRQTHDYTDYFVVCSAPNGKARDKIIQEAKLLADDNGVSVRFEKSEEWTIMDFGNFLVHIFLPRARNFYRLERLWSGLPQERIATAKKTQRASRPRFLPGTLGKPGLA